MISSDARRGAGSSTPREESGLFEERVAKKIARRASGEKRERRVDDRAWGRLKDQARAMMRGEERWAAATPSLFVALYAVLHEHVYEVAPEELLPAARARAAGMASLLLKRHFGGGDEDESKREDARERFAAFVRWSWQREQAIEKRRRATGGSGRLGWYRQFDGSLLTEYRLAQARAR